MINPRRLKGAPASLARYYTIGDYYTKSPDEYSEWGGALAADLGLSGKVDPQIVKELLAGKVAGQQLGRFRREGGIEHHPGWDFTVSAPKSVSVMALVTGHDAIVTAHERAVGVAIDYLEEHASTRRRVEGKIVHETTGRLLSARFTEHASRELDPHLHTHVVVMNMTNREDGAAMTSLETRAMFAEQMTAGQVYRNELAWLLKVLSSAPITDQEKLYARFYSGGQVVTFGRGITAAGIARGIKYRVVGIGREPNGRQVVKLADHHGQVIRWAPRLGQVRHVNVFNVEERDLAKGDRIQWRLVSHELGLKNADRGTVEKLANAVATIRWDRDGRVQEVDLDRHRTWDHGYAETVYSAQSKTYARVFVLAPVASALVNGQNYYTAITRARFGVKLWTENPKLLAEKLERNSGEKTSSLESLGRLNRDGHRAVAERHPDQLREGRAEQERWREQRRARTLTQKLGRRPAPPNGIGEQLAEGAREIAVRLERLLQAVLDRERTPDREGSEAPVHVPGAPSHSPDHAALQRGPER